MKASGFDVHMARPISHLVLSIEVNPSPLELGKVSFSCSESKTNSNGDRNRKR